MTCQSGKLLLLDCQGVLLTSVFKQFLSDVAGATDQDPTELYDRWESELRIPTWRGEISEQAFWRAITNQPAPHMAPLRAAHEQLYRTAPAATRLAYWNAQVPVWIVSNHRSEWLHPRLDRFGLTPFLDRVLVSDAMQVEKPNAALFERLAAMVEGNECLFVDDRKLNVLAAEHAGIRSLLAAQDDAAWLDTVDRFVTS